MPETLKGLSDTELIRAIKLSDAAAFKTFYGRYYDMLFRFLWRRTRNNEVAEDLLQELFTRVWQRRQKLDERQLIKAYLYKTANNLAIDHLRQKMTRQALATELQTPDYYVDLIDSLEIREEAEKALQSLSEKQRHIFLLSRFEGLKYAEIAEMLQISVKAVEKRMTKALQTLRQKLEHLLVAVLLLKESYAFWL